MKDHFMKGFYIVFNVKRDSFNETRDRTTSKFIEKHKGKFTQQSIRPLQGNGMAAISKILKRIPLFIDTKFGNYSYFRLLHSLCLLW